MPAKTILFPENIRPIRISAYEPELNPAEKVWEWMKNKVSMKFFAKTKALQNKIAEMVHQSTPDMIKSTTGYEIYTNSFFD